MRRTALALLLTATAALAQDQSPSQTNDEPYGSDIRRFTTGPQFITELVDHLPASDRVPSPLKFHGYVAGAEGRLTYSADVHRYMRALEAASPRVKVLSIGKSEEGREMIVVAISSEETIRSLDRYRDITRKLSDPRSLSEDEARKLIAEGKPLYYATGAMHSQETGSPEMLMELAYRLAVEETPFIRKIRDNVIVLLTPVLEVDGRDRMVDLWNYRKNNPGKPTPPLVYWGRYVAHDNNRDNMGLHLALSRNVMKAYFDFHPQVVHDLHESIPFLYISTGTGPFNPALDPVMIDEWHRMAFHEVDQLTRRGLPGVWTHGFYDGWAPNYMFWIGMGHNSIGRFYETFGNRWPTTETRVIRGASDRAWYRTNPPLPTVRWSLRNNVNYQQSALLFGLSDMAERRTHFLEQFWLLGKRSIAKAANEGPAAYVFDASQKRQGNLHELFEVLRRHGVEIHVADEAFSVMNDWPPKMTADDKSAESKDKDKEKEKEKPPAPLKFAKGSYIVRLDQPYSRLADTLLDVQYVRGEEKVYDDTGWTLGLLKNLDFKRIVNPAVLKVPMRPWSGPAPMPPLTHGVFAVENNADIDVARFVFAARGAKLYATDEEATFAGRKWPAGSILIDMPTPEATSEIHHALESTRLMPTGVGSMPDVKRHELRLPRVAVLHTWIRTQDEGWYRLALEQLGVPYAYLSTQDVSAMPNLREKYDVILFPPVDASSSDIVNGLPSSAPLPWKKTDLTPNLGGIDETDDMRPGLGLTGMLNLQRFVEEGGLLVTARDTSQLVIEYGLARWVRVVAPSKLKAPGTILQAVVKDKKSPVAWGYDEKVPIYFAGEPIFEVGVENLPGTKPPTETRPSGRGSKSDPDVPQGRVFVAMPERPKPKPGEEGFMLPEDSPWTWEPLIPVAAERPRVIVSFAEKADQLLLSGMLEGGDEIAGKPAVILSPRGKGNILLFAINPMWRMNTQGQYALVMNAVMNWDALR